MTDCSETSTEELTPVPFGADFLRVFSLAHPEVTWIQWL